MDQKQKCDLAENSGSLPIIKAKQRRAWLVPTLVTPCKQQVLQHKHFFSAPPWPLPSPTWERRDWVGQGTDSITGPSGNNWQPVRKNKPGLPKQCASCWAKASEKIRTHALGQVMSWDKTQNMGSKSVQRLPSYEVRLGHRGWIWGRSCGAAARTWGELWTLLCRPGLRPSMTLTLEHRKRNERNVWKSLVFRETIKRSLLRITKSRFLQSKF